ncbi:MAG: hypothetical protein KME10_24340 [Plectolyngbya sp. WJT66-NPBG17]|nr:hypothetical protein [Plectolyngbya sp. WJT66-NPBG17]
MSNKQPARKPAMGINPLGSGGGLFDKTEPVTPTDSETSEPSKSTSRKKQESQNLETRKKNLENTKEKSGFLQDIETSKKESIGLQVTTEVNDWLDDLVKANRRNTGRKLPKQVLIQAGIELLRAMPVDWSEVGDIEELRSKLSQVARLVEERQ